MGYQRPPFMAGSGVQVFGAVVVGARVVDAVAVGDVAARDEQPPVGQVGVPRAEQVDRGAVGALRLRGRDARSGRPGPRRTGCRSARSSSPPGRRGGPRTAPCRRAGGWCGSRRSAGRTPGPNGRRCPYRRVLSTSVRRSTSRLTNPTTAAIHDRRTFMGSSWPTAGCGPARVRAVKLREDEVRVPVAGRRDPRRRDRAGGGDGPRQGVLLYTDIFQLTESTLRTARRLASSGFVVCVPEIYPHGELAGVALEFDDAGKAAGPGGRGRDDRRAVRRRPGRGAGLPRRPRRRRRAVRRRASASAATSRSGRRSTRGSRPRCASTRRGCTTARSAPTPTRARWPGRGRHRRPAHDRLRVAGPARARRGAAAGRPGAVRGRAAPTSSCTSTRAASTRSCATSAPATTRS